MSRQDKRKNFNGNKERSANYRNNSHAIETIEAINTCQSILNMGGNIKIIQIEILQQIIPFQIDSNATVSVINLKTYSEINSPKLEKSNKILNAFGPIPIMGELRTTARYGDKQYEVSFIVANVENSCNLFCMDLFQRFGFDIHQVANVVENATKRIKELCTKYKEVFLPALGSIKSFKANIVLKPTATPKFNKSRQIVFAQLEKFKAEAERLTKLGKQLCLAIGHHQLYSHLSQEAQYKTNNGCQYTFGSFSISASTIWAPAIFQRYLQQLLSGVEGCANYLDDIIITAPTVEEHLSRVE